MGFKSVATVSLIVAFIAIFATHDYFAGHRQCLQTTFSKSYEKYVSPHVENIIKASIKESPASSLDETKHKHAETSDTINVATSTAAPVTQEQPASQAIHDDHAKTDASHHHQQQESPVKHVTEAQPLGTVVDHADADTESTNDEPVSENNLDQEQHPSHAVHEHPTTVETRPISNEQHVPTESHTSEEQLSHQAINDNQADISASALGDQHISVESQVKDEQPASKAVDDHYEGIDASVPKDQPASVETDVTEEQPSPQAVDDHQADIDASVTKDNPASVESHVTDEQHPSETADDHLANVETSAHNEQIMSADSENTDNEHSSPEVHDHQSLDHQAHDHQAHDHHGHDHHAHNHQAHDHQARDHQAHDHQAHDHQTHADASLPNEVPSTPSPETEKQPETEPNRGVDSIRLFTKEELALYDGSPNSPGIYLAYLGHVFDVTKGRQHYGPGGGYHFFAGKDATRAFVTGEFNDKGLIEDVSGLPLQTYSSLSEWLQFYHKDYTFVGKLIGHYFDENGQPTEAFTKFQQSLGDSLKAQSNQQEDRIKFPDCNSRWAQGEGGTLWCTNRSGGIERDWVGVPRKYYEPGKTTWRCACVRTTGGPSDQANAATHNNRGDLDNPHLREYDNCAPTSASCPMPE